MKNSILIDLERARYINSGIAKVFLSLAQGLEEVENTRLNISFFGPELNIPSKRFNVKNWKKWHKLSPFLAHQYDLVHVSHQLSSYFHRKPLHQKKLVTLHDLNFLHENFSKSKLNRNLNRVKKNLQNADVVVCISEFVKQDYLKNRHLFKIKDDQEITVIYNGLQFPDERESFGWGKFEYLKKRKFFLNIGVLFPKKNQLSILKTLPFLDQDLVLVVSDSKKEYEEEILKFIKANSLGDRVHILRNITDEEKYSLIENCEAMIHPSLAEGFGIPPVEAMYFGKPVFLSKLTSLPEIGGEQAFYFDNFETGNMVEIIKNGMQAYHSDKKSYSLNLQTWARKFDYRKMATEYHKLYERLLSNA